MHRNQFPRVVVAGMKGGSGKTTVSLGVVAALKKQGLSVVTFKKGPDYIDAGWLAAASGVACYNLDPFLVSKERIINSFLMHFDSADCAVIEGNRGLYDGMDAAGTYSTAELAKMLLAPVILVIDCSKVTRTVGAMVLGMKQFDKKLNLSGIVLNQIAGVRHEKVIREAIEKYCRIPVVGAIPRLESALLAERHMGLTPFQEHPDVRRAVNAAAGLADKYLDLKMIWLIAKGAGRIVGRKAGALPQERLPALYKEGLTGTVKIGIVRDSAFQFYYQENLDELARRGAQLLEVSALSAKRLPDIDALYIGGGFPETNAIDLARNQGFRRAVKDAVEAGLPVYAECGGLMYLGESIVMGGRKYPMTGVFPIEFYLEKKPQAHGYTIVEVTGDNPFYPEGTILKGHEFHYSRVVKVRRKKGMKFAFAMKRGSGIMDRMDGACYNNALATYTHLHAYGSTEWADGMIAGAIRFKKDRNRNVTESRNRKTPPKRRS